MKKIFDTFSLKWITVAMMSAGMVLQQIGGVEQIGLVLYLMSFPLAAFLLVEGEKHTSNKKRFLLRLLIAALVVEIPMDLAFKGVAGIRDWGSNQNCFFVFALGLCVIYTVEALAKRFTEGTFRFNMLTLAVYLVAAFLAHALCLELASVGILVIVALYLLGNNKVFSLIAVAALYILFMGNKGGLEYLPALGLLLTFFYNGSEGKKSKLLRILCYAAYPVVCCVLGIVVRLL